MPADNSTFAIGGPQFSASAFVLKSPPIANPQNVGGHALTDKFSSDKKEKLTAGFFQRTISHGVKTQLR